MIRVGLCALLIACIVIDYAFALELTSTTEDSNTGNVPVTISGRSQSDYNPCLENHTCAPIYQCRVPLKNTILYPCHFTDNSICCPVEYVSDSATQIPQRTSSSLFPLECGVVMSADRIIAGTMATAGQFPWMALLGYTQSGIDIIQFLCGGTAITEKYILTAAHCINIDFRLELTVVRLGELNLETELDCEETSYERVCSDPYVEYQVDRIRVHEQFNNATLVNDIALIRLRNNINFTDFIQPICLPREPLNMELFGAKKFFVSGWGKTNTQNFAGSSTLQYTTVTVWDEARCNRSVPIDIRPVQVTQICANGAKREDACKGDSGGPLTNVLVEDYIEKNYQIGIVSFASAQICGNPELPTIYTRVDQFLTWITDNVTP